MKLAAGGWIGGGGGGNENDMKGVFHAVSPCNGLKCAFNTLLVAQPHRSNVPPKEINLLVNKRFSAVKTSWSKRLRSVKIDKQPLQESREPWGFHSGPLGEDFYSALSGGLTVFLAYCVEVLIVI